MAIQVIAGIPWLAGVLGGIFASLFTWLAQFVTRRLAIVVACISIILTLTVAFFAAVHGAITGLASISPPQLGLVLGFVMPSNFPSCLTVILTTHTLRWAYEWNVKIVQMKLF